MNVKFKFITDAGKLPPMRVATGIYAYMHIKNKTRRTSYFFTCILAICNMQYAICIG